MSCRQGGLQWTHSGNDECQVELRIKILDGSVQSRGECIGKEPRQVRISQPRFHIGDYFLPLSSFPQGLTSTAELLKVLHSGEGRMLGLSLIHI